MVELAAKNEYQRIRDRRIKLWVFETHLKTYINPNGVIETVEKNANRIEIDLLQSRALFTDKRAVEQVHIDIDLLEK